MLDCNLVFLVIPSLNCILALFYLATTALVLDKTIVVAILDLAFIATKIYASWFILSEKSFWTASLGSSRRTIWHERAFPITCFRFSTCLVHWPQFCAIWTMEPISENRDAQWEPRFENHIFSRSSRMAVYPDVSGGCFWAPSLVARGAHDSRLSIGSFLWRVFSSVYWTSIARNNTSMSPNLVYARSSRSVLCCGLSEWLLQWSWGQAISVDISGVPTCDSLFMFWSIVAAMQGW